MIGRIESGVPNLDALFGGGIPRGSMVVFGGPPGSGKTVLAQQICFHNATPERRVLYFSTLSESTAKALLHLKQFSYFDAQKLERAVEFVDLGEIVRGKGTVEATTLIMEHVKRVKPAVVVVDSFKVFDDLAGSREELRKFGYEIAIQMMAWECTTLLVGEFASRDFQSNPLFSIVDGLVMLTQRDACGESQRFCRIIKMRGTTHVRDEQTFTISEDGVGLCPRYDVADQSLPPSVDPERRLSTGVVGLDALLGGGLLERSVTLVSGSAGIGKSTLALQFVLEGARLGQPGLYVALEEGPEQLGRSAVGLGLPLAGALAGGGVEIVHLSRHEIRSGQLLALLTDRIRAQKAVRLALDGANHLEDKGLSADQVRQLLCTLMVRFKTLGVTSLLTLESSSMFAMDTTSDAGLSPVADNLVFLRWVKGADRLGRTLTVVKTRASAHHHGTHDFEIGTGGLLLAKK